MELVAAMQTIGFADFTDELILFRAGFFLVQQDLNGAFHRMAKFPFLIINITFYRWHTLPPHNSSEKMVLMNLVMTENE